MKKIQRVSGLKNKRESMYTARSLIFMALLSSHCAYGMYSFRTAVISTRALTRRCLASRRPPMVPATSLISIPSQLEGFESFAGKLPAEIKEFMDMVSHPKPYRKMGVKMPKGMLLVGSPGVGKTAIARAIAAEYRRDFLPVDTAPCLGRYIGTGVEIITKTFKQAEQVVQKTGSCIVFFDEIDTIGAKRSERDTDASRDNTATLNALLTRMDGFKAHDSIFIMGATNRKSVLDPALLRPGRFEYIVHVPLPDYEDRRDIIKLYLKRMSHDLDDATIEWVTNSSLGFSGDHIRSMVNRAGILAVRARKHAIERDHITQALNEMCKHAGLNED